ncbi:hypothetical protein U0070_012224 [Myodes glareolus]|uniref:Uncharacterized protein n=1 Tax=Myodes glareolus TaxID=447135 RepID=A0AAW0JEY5_MYOGA
MPLLRATVEAWAYIRAVHSVPWSIRPWPVPLAAHSVPEMTIDDTALRMAVPQESIKGGNGSEDWGAAERT